MKCPNCGKKMTETCRYRDRTEPYDGFWTRDYIARIYYYNCKDCKIKYKVDTDLCTHEWTLPKEMRPTEKQVSYAKKIIKWLRLDRYDAECDLITKHQYWEFINKNKDAMDKKMKECQELWKNRDDGLEDFDYWDLPEIGINGF